MEKNRITNDYLKKIDQFVQEISRLAYVTEEIRPELFSSIEILQKTMGGKILLLFLDVSLQFFSRLIPILLSRTNTHEADDFNRKRMQKIDYYIQLHLEKGMKEKELAEFVGMSTGHFSRFFSKMYQCRFIEYLTRYKVNFAAKLLEDSDIQIFEISCKSGFASHNHFNRAFKNVKKMTPSEYRGSKKDDGYQ